MNVADSEVVAAIMQTTDCELTEDLNEADIVVLNTCSIRDNAEQKVQHRLQELRGKNGKGKTIGVIGCMAERMGESLLKDWGVDFVAGPDAYLDIPNLLIMCDKGLPAINIKLSTTETYREVMPARIGKQISGFVSIMRGCNNLQEKGYKEVTLLGQNVNSYRYARVREDGSEEVIGFAQLLAQVAEAVPDMRIRFTTSHPKDMSDETLEVIAKHKNLCKFIHLPVQSGSNKILKLMNRKYTREWYLDRIAAIRRIIPDASIGTDVFCGFHDESIEDHAQTLSLMREVGFDTAFMFKYSERPGTHAQKHLPDNISEEEKVRRLNEIIALQNQLSLESNQREIGKVVEVLVEGYSKRSKEDMYGRTSQYKTVVFPREGRKIGELVMVKIEEASAATLKGKLV